LCKIESSYHNAASYQIQLCFLSWFLDDYRLHGTSGSILYRFHGTSAHDLTPSNILFYPVLIAGSMEHMVLSCADCRLLGTYGSILCWLQAPWNMWFYPVLLQAPWNIWFYPVLIAGSMEHIVLSCVDCRLHGTYCSILCWLQAP
jgi:hypothetical protein